MKKVMVFGMVLGALALFTLTVLAPSPVLAQDTTATANPDKPKPPQCPPKNAISLEDCQDKCGTNCPPKGAPGCKNKCTKMTFNAPPIPPIKPPVIGPGGKKSKTTPVTPVDEICLFTGQQMGVCPDGCPAGQILAPDGKNCVPKCDTDVCASDVMAQIEVIKATLAKIEAKPATAGVDLTWIYVCLGAIGFLLIIVLVRQGSKKDEPTPKPPVKCAKCGKEFSELPKFCDSCGEKFPEPPAPTATPPASPPADTQTK